MSVNNHAVRLAEVGRRAEAVTVSQEAVDLRRELADLNRDAYLGGYVQSLAVSGHVLVADKRPREAVPALVEALVLGQELPEEAQGILGLIIDLLRQCYAVDAQVAADAFRAVTGQGVPEWMRQPPASGR